MYTEIVTIRCLGHLNSCHPERSEGPMHLLAAPQIRSLPENTVQVQDRAPFLIFGNASSTRRAGRAQVRPQPCTIGDRA